MAEAPISIEIFCSYAHEDVLWQQKLETHLSLLKRQGMISTWHDRLIVPGTDWAKDIDSHLEKASIILLLISADFMASDYCYSIEMQRALQHHRTGEVLVIPILLRPVDLNGAPFAHLQALPTNIKAITTWENEDAAFADVTAGIRRAIDELLKKNVPRNGVSSDHERTLKDYLSWVIAMNSKLTLSGIGGVSSISLETVYVALKGDKTSDYEHGQARELLDTEVFDNMNKNIRKAREEISEEEFLELKMSVLQNKALSPSLMLRDYFGQHSTQFAEVLSLAQAFQTERRLIILGGPGSGKTTLVQWLALKLASALATSEASQGAQRVYVPVKQIDPDLSAVVDLIDLGPARLPILVRVSDYAVAYANHEKHKSEHEKQNSTLALIDYLGYQPWLGRKPERNFGETVPNYIPNAELRELFLTYINQGRAVIILDGLDELTEKRAEVTHEIQIFVSTIKGQGEPILSGGNQVVITSRIAGYRLSPIRGENLAHVTIESMKRPAVEQFCRDMIAAVNGREGQNDEADLAQAQGLIDAIYDVNNWRVRELASNPLLITMLSLVYHEKGNLPQQRATLYQMAMEALIKRVWQTTSMVTKIGNEALINILAGVAASIHQEEPSGLLRKNQLVAKMTESIIQSDVSKSFSSQNLLEELEDFISVVNNDVGLLAARGNGLYGFLHLTFQEYLAGIYLVRDQKQAHNHILKYLDSPRWREPILLALGYIGTNSYWSQEAREHLLRELFNAPDPLKRFLPRMVLLVAKTIPEMGQIDDGIINDVVERLITVYGDQRLLTEYSIIENQVEDALVTLRLYNQKGVDNALIKFVRENPTLISALAQLVYKHGWLTNAIVETLQRYIDYDSPEWGWVVNRVLQNLVTPLSHQTELQEPQPPESPNLRYHKMRNLQEELRKLDEGETLASIATEIKVIYQRKAEMEGTDFPSDFNDFDDSASALDANLERVGQLLNYLEAGNFKTFLERVQQLLNGIKDGRYRTRLLENIVQEENGYKAYQIEYKSLSADYAIVDAAYLERKKQHQQVVRAPLSLEYLKLKTALKRNRHLLQFIQNDPIWLRLITAFYGGFGDYEATFWSQEHRELTALLSLDESSCNYRIAQNREYYIGKWGYPQTVQKIREYLESKQNGNYQRINLVPEFQIDYIYRGTFLHQHLLDSLFQNAPAASLTPLLWGIWHDESALPEKRIDALVALALLGQDVLQTLRQGFDSERHFSLAQKVLLKMSQIASSLEDAVVRSREGILEQISTMFLPDVYWIDFVQTVIKTLIVATNQPVDIERLALKAPVLARPLLEADAWFFSIVSIMTDSLIPTDRLVDFSARLKRMRQRLKKLPPKDLADHYTRVVLSAWRAPNVAAAPMINLSHSWQLDPLASENTDPYDISIDLLDGLESFYAMNDLHPLYSSAFRTYVLMSFQEYFQHNPDLLSEIILLCLPYLSEEPHLISHLDPGFTLAEQSIPYLQQKILQISHPFYRARALLRLIPYNIFPSATFLSDFEQLVAHIQAAYDEIEDVQQKVVIMERFIQYHSVASQEELLQRHYANISLLPHKANRVRALVRFARLSPTLRQPEILSAAVLATTEIQDEHVKSELLYLIGLHANRYPDVMVLLYNQTQTLATDWLQAKARGLLATHLLRSKAEWAETIQNQTLWTPLLVSASLHEICAYFVHTDSLESLWVQFADNPSNERLFMLLDRGAETGLVLTHTAVRAIDSIITHENVNLLHNLLPLLHGPSINDIGIIETWLRSTDSSIANHAALFITEASRKLTPRYIPRLLSLLNGNNDRSRDRVYIMLVNGIENVNDRDHALRVSTLGHTALEMLVSDSLKIDESGRELFSNASWVLNDVIHDSPEQLQRWIVDYGKHPSQNVVSKYILQNIMAITDNTLNTFLNALISKDVPIHVQKALLTSVCNLAVTQKKNKKLFNRIFPVLREMPTDVLDTISVLLDRYKAVVDAARATLPENEHQFKDPEDIIKLAESILLSSAVTLSSIIQQPDKAGRLRLVEIGDTFFVPLNVVDPKTIEAANSVGQNPELLKTLVLWMQKSLQEFCYEGVDDPYQKLNALLCVVAEVAKSMPATFANLAQPDVFEPLLIYAACHADHYKSRCAAIELLGLLRFVTGRITQLLKPTLKDFHDVKQATLGFIGNLQYLQHDTITELIKELCDEEMLYHENASIVYSVATILSLLGRNANLDKEQRLTIQTALASAADDPRSRRGVYVQTGLGTVDSRLHIVLLRHLNQAIFRAALETVGML